MPKVKKGRNVKKKPDNALKDSNLIDYHEIVATGNVQELNKQLTNGVKGFNR